MTFRVKKTANFCQISNEALRDTRLSYCARGILAMVMTHSDEWKTSNDWLRENTKSEGKVTIGNAIKELKEAGYLKITPLYVDGRFNGHVWSWSDAPQSETSQTSRNQDLCEEAPRKRECVTEHESPEHQEEEEREGDADASATPPEASLPKGNPPVPHPKHSAPPPPTPLAAAPAKQRPRNPLLDVMVEVCWGVQTGQSATASQYSLGAKAISEIKAVQPDLTPEMIRSVGASLRKQWDGTAFTPAAMAKHWVHQAPVSGAEADPWGGAAKVTTRDLVEKFPSGTEQRIWRNRLMAQGRYA